ncbi:hypothetical protein E4U17_001111 [Claviceps sp. LM77 group G4]|nr:hypothetical protein E4U17_001111 [Claviceps sp. LM77 group G4]KAG6063103.1 hypothetical protein E4U33_006399 [Claviceps sp. LM78 group G4]KAG6080499.1 hypothetical protein E4U16_000271 [Claviceps sp. LM84 group G4]
MSGNKNKNSRNLPEGVQSQGVGHRPCHSMLDATSATSFMPAAQSSQSHMLCHQSDSRILAMPQPTRDLGIDMQGMYSPAQNHAISCGLSFPNISPPVSGFTQSQQQSLYSQSNNGFQTPLPAFETDSSNGFNSCRFLGFTFRDLKLQFGGADLADSRQAQIRALRRLEYLTENPPALPENTVEEMQPKKVFPDYVKLAPDASAAELEAAEKINNAIAQESLRIDRERNNEAAKRSRRLKNENLDNANQQLVQNALQIAWLEAQLSALGGCPEAFDSISPNIKKRLHDKIIDRRDRYYERRRKEKGKRETRKRSEHNRRRAAQKRELNERTIRQCLRADIDKSDMRQRQRQRQRHHVKSFQVGLATNAAVANEAAVDEIMLDEGVVLSPDQHTPKQVQPQGQPGQGPGQDGEPGDGFPFAEDGALNESFILVGHENEWDNRLA